MSDNPRAGSLARASQAGIDTAVVEWTAHQDRMSFSTAVADVVEDAGAKGVVLAGFMRILAASFIDRFPDRVLNIHPSLLPSFPGAHAVELALEHGVKVAGVTVHFVDEQVDHGPIVAQIPVDVAIDDTTETLHARIQIQEHDLYPKVVEAMVDGRLYLDGDKVIWK